MTAVRQKQNKTQTSQKEVLIEDEGKAILQSILRTIDHANRENKSSSKDTYNVEEISQKDEQSKPDCSHTNPSIVCSGISCDKCP